MENLQAVLIGGPDDFPLGECVRQLDTLHPAIRHEFGTGFDSFRFSGERMPFDPSVVIYEWSHREYYSD
jgi:hypothetical protein